MKKTEYMIRYRHGDVVLADFPYTNLINIKTRPVLVVSSDWYNISRSDVIVLPISSQVPTDSSELKRDDYLLSEHELRVGGLSKPSIVKVGKIMTMHNSFIKKTLGRLPEETLRQLIRKLLDVLGPEYVGRIKT